MRSSIKNLSLLAVGFSTLLLVGCGKSDSASGDAVVVNGEPISMKEYYSYLQLKPKMQVVSANQQGQNQVVTLDTAGTPGFQAMRDLIVSKVIEQLAKEDKVFPSDDDVAKELEFQQKINPNIVQQALVTGYTIDTLKHQFKDDLSRFNILTKGIVITPVQVDAYIKQHPEQFETPASADVLMILVRNAADKKPVDTQLASGQPFQIVAQQYSQDPQGRVNNYHYAQHLLSRMPPLLAKSVTDTGKNQIVTFKTPKETTQWIHATEGWAKFYIENKTEASPIKTDDPILKERVRRLLAQQQGTKAVDLDKRIADKLKDSQKTIQVLVKQNQEPWKQFSSQLNQLDTTGTSVPSAPKQGAEGTTSTPSATKQ